MISAPVCFRLLGTLETTVEGRPVTLTGRQRALMSVLLLRANRVVPVDRIADSLWGESLPASAAARVRALIAEVRRALGPHGQERVVTRSPGYLVNVCPGELDIDEFEVLVGEARRAARGGRHEEAIALYERALELWRGEPFPDLNGPAAESERHRFEEMGAGAVEGRVEANLALGRGQAVVADLMRLIADQPLREQPRRQLMLALNQLGRLPEALEVYRDFHTRLVTDLGVEPTPRLRQLHQRMLVGGPELSEGADSPREPAGERQRTLPRQVPAVGRFVGREDQLRQLDEYRAGADRVVLIVGPAGVGKTSVAAHWAHRNAEYFPDGQLFLDMRGFDRAEPMSVSEALPLLLQGLGQPLRDIPVSVDAQIALYRSLLARRRILLVLDDVAEPAQVRVLLPPNPQCLAVITSRDRLRSLVALDGARRLTLDVLSQEEALGLIAQGAGSRRSHDEPEAAAELAELCDRLPLALCVAVSWLADQEHRTIGQYVRELTDRGRLAQLRVEGDEHAAVRAALELSYVALPASARRVFRLLGLVPSVDVTVAATAAQANSGLEELRVLLATVARVHLIQEVAVRRYTCHDLVREYAAERGREEDTEADRHGAVRRLLDYYVDMITRVNEVCGFLAPNLAREAEAPVAPVEEFSAEADATTWFDAEWENLLVVIAHAAEHGPRRYAWLLVEAMQDLLHHRRTHVEWLRVAGTALAAAKLDGDLVGQAAMHLSLGMVRWRMADLRTALTENERALTLSRRAGWLHGEAMALTGCGVALKQLGEARRALPRYRKSLEISRRLGHARSEVRGLNNLASAYLMLARLESAEECLLANIPLTEESGDRHLQSLTLVNLGIVRQQRARFPQALEALEKAMEVSRSTGLIYAEGVTFETFGWVHSDAGRHEQAVASFDAALSIARQVENRNSQIDSLTGLAVVELKLGRVDTALDRLGTARDVAEGVGTGFVGVLMGLARVHLRQGRYEQAHDEASRSLRLAAEGSPLDLPRLHGLLAAIQLAAGDSEQCLRSCDQALQLARRSGQRLEHARALITLGHAHRLEKRERAARSAWRRAHGHFTALDTPEQRETAALLA
ncbi:tetratricopeptide repeat protein [Streptomyces sp. NPDC051569]|uniref:AfsR/SARP family transcriptional regulator n=1 Tax=Streptomyces sp. NPDC051569 TaxID=3365661 RepID=UPI0037ACEFFD